VGSTGIVHQNCPGSRMTSRKDGGFGRNAVAGVNTEVLIEDRDDLAGQTGISSLFDLLSPS